MNGVLGRRFAVLAVAVTAVACGGDPGAAPSIEPPVVVVAEPAPPSTTSEATPAETPSDAPSAGSIRPSSAPEPTTSDTATTTGPTSADAAAFVAAHSPAGVTDLDHVVVDLDGDAVNEVVTTGVRDRRGVVRVAWWSGDGYEVLATGEAGRGTAVADLRAADVNQDGLAELLVSVEGEGLRSLAVFAVPGRAELVPLEAVDGCHDGSHVFGVTDARLEARGEQPPAIVGTCDDSPLPVADWSEQRWIWSDGAYRLEAGDSQSG